MPNVAAPTFIRGQTYYGASGTIPTTPGTSVQYEGFEKAFKDDTAVSGTGAKGVRSAREIYCRCVRNASGINLLPKRLVAYKSGYWGQRVDGYTSTDFARPAGVVDDQLPASGVRNGDLFWLQYRGPALCTTDPASAGTNVHTQGVGVVALTAAASTFSTTAGRVQTYFVTSNATIIGSQAMNLVGIAMSAKTTAQTNADVLVDLTLA